MTAPANVSGAALARMSTEQLAHRVRQQQAKGGVAFARRSERPEKADARTALLYKLSRDEWPKGLSIITMPGLYWTFEHELLRKREGPARCHQPGRRPAATFVEAIESDEAIYRASFRFIPGADEFAVRTGPECSTSTLRTRLVTRFHRCAFEDFAYVEGPPIGAAWLDFTGPLTERRIEALRVFCRQRQPIYLAVACMRGRESRVTSEMIRAAGGRRALIAGMFERSRVLSCRDYQDTTPMFQVLVLNAVRAPVLFDVKREAHKKRRERLAKLRESGSDIAAWRVHT